MKKIASVARCLALSACAAALPVQAAMWNLTFNDVRHLYEASDGIPIDYGNVTISGHLLGEDYNHDNRISKDEVWSLSIAGYSFGPDEISHFSITGNVINVSAIGFRSKLDSTGLFYISGGYNDSYYAGPTSRITFVASPVPEVASTTMLIVGLVGFSGFLRASRRLRSPTP
ncbi:hypothetical protein [Pelomonas sp. Root1444]|uniref:hypothetical protein n=1 Tax=Pelomonas sp. Root1444 TaxID=1736464 RepID=UPI0012F75709|nr:hypothetical protein [Pelomonas sp. Root1444]